MDNHLCRGKYAKTYTVFKYSCQFAKGPKTLMIMIIFLLITYIWNRAIFCR